VILDENSTRFESCNDTFCFNHELSTITGTDDVIANNFKSTRAENIQDSVLNNISASNITDFVQSNGQDIRLSSLTSLNNCSVSHISSSNLNNADHSFLNNVENSNLTGVTRSQIQGFNINIDFSGDGNTNVANFLNLFGQDITITGKVETSHSKIQGLNINLLGSEGTSSTNEYFYCDIHGRNIIMTGDQLIHATVRGNQHNISGDSEYVLVHGDDINIIDAKRSVFIGRDIVHSGRSSFIFGDNITSSGVGASVIKDSKLTQTEDKGQDTLFLDFEKGTYLNIPSGNSSNTTTNDGVPGSLLYSGEFLLIKTGQGIPSNTNPHQWGKVQILPL
jgi:hypothetical protein